MLKIPHVVRELGAVFRQAGHECYLVGGAVRDMLMGRPTEDFDIATGAQPADVMRMFRRVIPTGIEHGTVTVHYKGTQFEVTTYRTEGKYTDGRRPDHVSFVPSIQEDLRRRDFTINAMAVDLSTGRLTDLHGGQRDLADRTLRAIGDPEERFREDGLRLMRACRFSAQLDFAIEGRTLEAMRTGRDAIRPVAAERIREELERMLAAERPSTGLTILHATGLLEIVLPELERCVGVEQRGLHCFDVWRHSLESCDAAPQDNPRVRLAALLHDIGKPPSAVLRDDGVWTFHGHEETGAVMTEELLRRLRFPNATVSAVTHLVRCHMFHYTPDWTDAAVRRFVARVGVEHLDDLLALRRADQIGMCGQRGVSESLVELDQRVRNTLERRDAFTLRDLAVDGNAVMQELGLGPGRTVGLILEELLQAALDDPGLNERETLLGIARRYYEARLSTQGSSPTGGSSAS